MGNFGVPALTLALLSRLPFRLSLRRRLLFVVLVLEAMVMPVDCSYSDNAWPVAPAARCGCASARGLAEGGPSVNASFLEHISKIRTEYCGARRREMRPYSGPADPVYCRRKRTAPRTGVRFALYVSNDARRTEEMWGIFEREARPQTALARRHRRSSPPERRREDF